MTLKELGRFFDHGFCPFCGSEQVVVNWVQEVNAIKVNGACDCGSCGKHWEVKYEAVSFHVEETKVVNRDYFREEDDLTG